MSMYEIDILLKNSIKMCKKADLHDKRNVIWNLEQMPNPNRLNLDAGCFEMSEVDEDFKYSEMNIFELIKIVMNLANKEPEHYHLIYDWSAFMMNFYEHIKAYQPFDKEQIKKDLQPVKELFKNHNFDNYEPIHPTLTVYYGGNDDWFGDEQNEFIKWYAS